ncbi:BMP family ABC transporter substrate-binding protein [Xinfangfangia sp. CPCC 101601]|uniref:BMP family ABC transporter substrate-binding protein n=1 Tax=Pseudogemmobacter lacusdianii TaxID=3069608 RepID=A0ABU0VZ25_9RHOB|nr:BMP family ABC transporter substrate-binding protein [Xinfangfangia sp. CPCC 101601]MDQ2066994.1 BMP family ABC transporter substrate-binding protein [Xinfangfangia sp. CPCC 101601]
MQVTRRKLLQGTAAMAGAFALPRAALAQDVLKIGQVNASPAAEIGWSKQHALGIEAIKSALGDKVEITVVDNTFLPQDAERVFRELASSGHKLMFGTSFSLGQPMQKVAPAFPDAAFEHCSGIVHLDNLGTFEAKYYEGMYVAGIAAGHMSKTGKLGFVGGFPIPDIVGPGNAFLLGARSVNPAITCSIVFMNSWFDPGKEKEAAQALIAQGADVILGMTDTGVCVQVAQEAGVWSVGYASDLTSFGPDSQLTSIVLDWSSEYVAAAEAVLAGTWKSESNWGGLNEGVVTLAPFNAGIPEDVRAKMDEAVAAIKSGALHPYGGEIKDVDGAVKVAAGEVLSDGDIRSMNWLVEGMIGTLG